MFFVFVFTEGRSAHSRVVDYVRCKATLHHVLGVFPSPTTKGTIGYYVMVMSLDKRRNLWWYPFSVTRDQSQGV